MRHSSELIQGRLIRRYKRFLADVELDGGATVTVYCPNTGAMTGCAEPNSRVALSTSTNLKRKYPHTWELVRCNQNKSWVGIHSARANKLFSEAFSLNLIAELSGYSNLHPEVKVGESRIDFLLQGAGLADCYVEVKSVTLLGDNGTGLFPDAVTTRGQRHLQQLLELKKTGARAVLFFCVQRSDLQTVQPADHIDAVYGELMRKAMSAGVEVLAYGAAVSLDEITLEYPLKVMCSGR